MLIPYKLLAQQTAQFESKVFFEDAKGNRDTIFIAYDTTALDYNPQFGEKNITEPWDSIFEVRAARYKGFQNGKQPFFLSKKIVSKTTGITHPLYYCPPQKSSILFFTSIKHFPLKITWDSKEHDNFCNFSNFIINNRGPSFFGDWYKGMPKNVYRCMSQDSTLTLPKDLEYNYDLYFESTLENGKTDSIIGVILYFAYKGHIFSNCGEVSTNDAFFSNLFKIFPNPAHDLLNISILEVEEELKVECYDLQGRLVYQSNFQNATQINTAAWQRGLYAVVIRDELGRLVKAEKVLLE